jgi:phosphodiesterase/alkaline phosphatase D-like protein
VSTDPATGVGQSGATLNATIGPGGVATTYNYEYGTTTAFATVIGPLDAGSGSTSASQPGQAIAGLASRTTYFYRVCAYHPPRPAPDTCGTVVAFTTAGAAVAASAVTGPATSITAGGASLSGTVNAHGQGASDVFEYGPTTAFGSITSPAGNAGSTSADLAVTGDLTGLAPNTTYFYRLVAANPTGTSVGAVMAFTTTGPPTAPAVTTAAAGGLKSSSAVLSGTVDPEGQQTAFTFEYGPTTTFGALSAIDNAGATGTVDSVSLPVTGLDPATTYFYRIVATNATGTSAGVVGTFTTP